MYVYLNAHSQNTPSVDFSANPNYEPEFKFYDGSLLDAVHQGDSNSVHNFFRLLALCHTVMPEEKNGMLIYCILLQLVSMVTSLTWGLPIAGRLEYQAQSPDESALVSAARNFGFVFKERSPNSITIEVRWWCTQNIYMNNLIQNNIQIVSCRWMERVRFMSYYAFWISTMCARGCLLFWGRMASLGSTAKVPTMSSMSVSRMEPATSRPRPRSTSMWVEISCKFSLSLSRSLWSTNTGKST